jgi:hypothetical protein
VTIRRGEDWGRTGPAPADLDWFDDDAAAASAYRDGVRSIGVRGGDLARTLGVGPETSTNVEATVSFPIDVVELTASDGRRTVAVAHVVVRRRRWGWWRGPILVVMNAQYIGRADVAPRGHPNDGRVDVLEVDAAMSIRQRILAARRLPIGAHVPHPLVRTRSVTNASLVIPPSAKVEVDGRPWIHESSGDLTVTVGVVPDALLVWIPGVRLEP